MRALAVLFLFAGAVASAQPLRPVEELRSAVSTADAGRIEPLGVVSGLAYFNALEGLYVTDGSTAGTRALADCRAGAVRPWAGGVYFSCGFEALAPWDRTYLVHTSPPGAPSVRTLPPTFIDSATPTFALGGFAFARGGPSGDPGLWRVDLLTGAESAGPRLSHDGSSVGEVSAVATSASRALLVVGSFSPSLWVTDGTDAGSAPLTAVPLFDGTPRAAPLGDRFVVTDGTGLWSSDLTVSGTASLGALDLRPEGPLFAVQGLVFFAASLTEGREPWRTDGTDAGTFLLADLVDGGSSDPRDFVAHGGFVYFTAVTPETGREVFRTDGGQGSVELAFETVAGPASSEPRALHSTDGGLFFFAAPRNVGEEPFVWTGEGDAGLLADVRPGPASSAPVLIPLPGRALFSADDGATGRELWMSDGTVPSTVLLADLGRVREGLGDSFGPSVARVNGDRLLIGSRDGRALLKLATDGHDGVVEQSFDGGRLRGPFHPLAGGAVVSADFDGTGEEPWFFNFSGPQYRVRDLAPGSDWSSPDTFVRIDAGLLFVATTAERGREFFFTDGTPIGTVPLLEAEPGPDSRAFYPPVRLGESAFSFTLGSDGGHGLFEVSTSGGGFVPALSDPSVTASGACASSTGAVIQHVGAREDAGLFLLRTGGEPRATSFFAPLPGATLYAPALGQFSNCPVALGEVALFVKSVEVATLLRQRFELWRTDGTDAGTFPLGAGAPTLSSMRSLLVASDRAYFLAYTDEHGEELWVTDGTTGGTRLVKDLLPGPASGVHALLGVSGKQVLLRGADFTFGDELWVSDGTSEGTRLVQDLWPGPLGSSPEVSLADGVLAVWADDGVSGRELWLGVEAALDPSPPTIDTVVTGTRSDAGVYSSDVTVTFVVDDRQSEVTSVAGCGPSSFTTDVSNVPLRCEVRSAGGTTVSSLSITRDTAPPSLSCPESVLLYRGEPLSFAVSYSDVSDPSPDVFFFPPLGTLLAPGQVVNAKVLVRDHADLETSCFVPVTVSTANREEGCGCGSSAVAPASFAALALLFAATRRRARTL